MKHMFMIACYFDPDNPVVFSCVNSIRDHHPDSKIIVIDSDSPDKSYFEELKKWNAEAIDAKNVHRETGAIWYIYENFSSYDYYYCLQDSLVINADLSSTLARDLTLLRYFPSWDGHLFDGNPGHHEARCGWGDGEDSLGLAYKSKMEDRDFVERMLALTPYTIPKKWDSVFGPIIMCKRSLLDKLYKNGFNKLLPKNKIESCAMERAWGIVLEQEGYSVRDLSLQGYYLHKGYRPNYGIEKVFLHR